MVAVCVLEETVGNKAEAEEILGNKPVCFGEEEPPLLLPGIGKGLQARRESKGIHGKHK